MGFGAWGRYRIVMTSPCPADISQKNFRSAMGGFNRVEVTNYLDMLSAEISRLAEERDSLASRLAQVGGQETDFDAFSHEIGQILNAAKKAADSLRSRTEEEIARWRSEAASEVAQQRTQAALDSQAMRTDAWTVSTQMLTQAQELETALVSDAEAEKTEIVAEAERAAMAVTGQSERDAHRLQVSARREVEEQLRLAKMESERFLVEARAEQEQILEEANAAAEAAQERARALEVRRNEMLTELESVRATVAKVESDLEQKRVSLEADTPEPEPDFSDVSSVKVIPAKPDPDQIWSSDVVKTTSAVKPELNTDEIDTPEPEPDFSDVSSVKVIPAKPDPDQIWSSDVVKTTSAVKPELNTDEIDAQEIADEILRMKTATAVAEEAKVVSQDAAVRTDQEQESEDAVQRVSKQRASDTAAVDAPDVIASTKSAEIDERPPEASDEPAVADATGPPALVEDALDGLFASLRNGETLIQEVSAVEEEVLEIIPAPKTDRVTVPVRPDVDVFELADQLLLPISNRILRSVKRQLTEAQNIALEGIRVDEESWELGTGELATDLHGDFMILAQESFEAGYSATEAMTGLNLGQAKPEAGDIIDHSAAFAEGLAETLEAACHPSEGPWETASAASRIFRAWRTDEAERRVRHHARDAYHRGISKALRAAGIESMFVSVGGRKCADCRTVSESGPHATGGDFNGAMPPLHDGCACTVIPGS